MAIVYVDSNASGANDGTSWTDAYALFASSSSAGAGDEVYVASDHSETSTVTLAHQFSNATIANPIRVISVDSSDDSYLPATIVQVERTSSGDINLSGPYVLYYGVYMTSGDDIALNGAADVYHFEDCNLEQLGAGGTFTIGNNSGQYVKLVNTDIIQDNGGNGLVVGVSVFEWNGGKLHFTGTAPSPGIINKSVRSSCVTLRNVDLSEVASTNLFALSAATGWGFSRAIDCKLNASTGLYDSIGVPGYRADMMETDDTTGNELFRREIATYYGDINIDDANYLKASDGANNYSWKVVTNANGAEFSEPIHTDYMAAWIDSTGSKTFTVEILTDNVTLQNDEIWLEVEYLGSSTETLGTVDLSNRVANILATPANQATSAETWTSPGVTTDLEQKLEATVTINRVGPWRVRVAVAKPSTTVWVDPNVTVA